ncbi:MAG: hypothetical protein K8R25_17030 [Methanosarcinales archaeon]|nr:hypothetical protein [Methanosarcinales archaeon]
MSIFNYGIYDTSGRLLKGHLKGYRDLAWQLDVNMVALYFESKNEYVILGCRFIVQIIGGRVERVLFIVKYPVKEINSDTILQLYKRAVEEIESLKGVKYNVLGLWKTGDIEDIIDIETIDNIYEIIVGKLISNEQIVVKSSDLSQGISLLAKVVLELKSVLSLGYKFIISESVFKADLLIQPKEEHVDIDIDNNHGIMKYEEKSRFTKLYGIYKELIFTQGGDYSFRSRNGLLDEIIKRDVKDYADDIFNLYQYDLDRLLLFSTRNPDILILVINRIIKENLDISGIRDENAVKIIEELVPIICSESISSTIEIFLASVYKNIKDSDKREIQKYLIKKNIFLEEIVHDVVKRIAKERDSELLYILACRSFIDPGTAKEFDRIVKNAINSLNQKEVLNFIKFLLDEPELKPDESGKILIKALYSEIIGYGSSMKFTNKHKEKLREFGITTPLMETQKGEIEINRATKKVFTVIIILIIFIIGIGIGEHYEPSNIIMNYFNTSSTSKQITSPPVIINNTPEEDVRSTIGEVKIFSVTANQSVNITWLNNESQVQQTNESVTKASYTNKSVAAGVWNISAKIENANGTDIKTWEWHVNSTST